MVAALRVENIPERPIHLRLYRGEQTRTPIPYGYQAKIGDKLEDLNLQILNTPVHIVHPNDREDKGIYLVEFNLDHLDFSRLDQNDVETLRKEIRGIEDQQNVKHLVISFYACHSLEKLKELDIKDDPQFAEPDRPILRRMHNSPELLYEPVSSEPHWTVNGGDSFADLLMEAKTYCRLNDKKLSVIHNEPKLETYGYLKGLPGFVHEILEHALKNSNDSGSNPAPKNEVPVYTTPAYTRFLRHLTVAGFTT